MEKETAVVGAGVEAINGMAAMGKTAVSLLFILGLIFLLSLLLKRLNQSSRPSSPVLKQVASASLGAREKVVVMEFNRTWLVLGVGGGQITKLHETQVLDAETAAALAGQSDSFASRFKKVLDARPGRPSGALSTVGPEAASGTESP